MISLRILKGLLIAGQDGGHSGDVWRPCSCLSSGGMQGALCSPGAPQPRPPLILPLKDGAGFDNLPRRRSPASSPPPLCVLTDDSRGAFLISACHAGRPSVTVTPF